MQILNRNNKRNKLLLLKCKPDKIKFEPEKISILYRGKESITSSCLRCYDPKCMYFNKQKIECSKLSDFSAEKDNKVCPVDALFWDNINEMPQINQSKCIKCGICANECPVGAIYFKENKFLVNDIFNNQEYIEFPFDLEGISKQKKFIEGLKGLEKQGKLLDENDEIMKIIYEKTESSNLMPEKFIRNILISLGCECSMNRIGDVYTRMDAVYKTYMNNFGTVEVEFGKDTLEAVRRILDDIAVLQSRYGINKNENNALVVCLSLPNTRQGYWQDIKDINNILNIKINTQTLGVMLILLWNFKKIDFVKNDYYIDYDNKSIRGCLERDIEKNIMISDKFLGILEPIK